MGRGRGSGAGEQGESPSYILKPGAYHSEFVWLVLGGPQLATTQCLSTDTVLEEIDLRLQFPKSRFLPTSLPPVNDQRSGFANSVKFPLLILVIMLATTIAVLSSQSTP